MIPVICTVPVTPELINEFLLETYNACPEASQSLVIITHTDWSRYANDESLLSPEEARKQKSVVRTHGGEPMRIASRPPWTHDFESPFLKQGPEEVAHALRNVDEAPGFLSRDYCAIIDQQSLEDRSALVVKTKRGPGEKLPPGFEDSTIVYVREPFREVNGLLQSAWAGVSSLTSTM